METSAGAHHCTSHCQQPQKNPSICKSPKLPQSSGRCCKSVPKRRLCRSLAGPCHQWTATHHQRSTAPRLATPGRLLNHHNTPLHPKRGPNMQHLALTRCILPRSTRNLSTSNPPWPGMAEKHKHKLGHKKEEARARGVPLETRPRRTSQHRHRTHMGSC